MIDLLDLEKLNGILSFPLLTSIIFFFQTLFIYIFSPVRPFNTLSNINRIIKKLKSRKKKDTTHVRKNKK